MTSGEPQPAEMLGARLGNYRIVEVLGEGGMGVVYVGRHRQLGHRVAVKVLRPGPSRNADTVQRFFNEAQAATAIRHLGIVQVFDFGRTPDGRAYFVMELLEGETLTARLKQRQLDAVECCRIGRQIANVLAAAHAAGITHRDLKPDNLFLIPDTEALGGERVKVLDFGIAKLAGEIRPSRAQTRADLVMGTPTYMSPEQCRGAGEVDNRSDIYSLGCILFRMACGRPPFMGQAREILDSHQLAPPPHPQSHAPDLPAQLATLIEQMLAKQPDERPQTMAAVSQALDEILQALGVPPARASLPPSSAIAAAGAAAAATAPRAPREPPTSPSSTTLSSTAGASSTRRRTRVRRLSFLISGSVAAGVVLGLAIVIAMRGPGSPEPEPARDESSAAPRAADGSAATAAAPTPPSRSPATDGSSGRETVEAAPGSAARPAGGTGAPAASEELEAECRRLQADRKWAELERCADKLQPLAPQRAAKLRTRAVEEARSAPSVAGVDAALRERNLKRAKAALDQIWAESAELPQLRRRYAAAEAQAIADLAARLDRVKDASCEEHKRLLARERAAQPAQVVAEAARRSPCTPSRCDADASLQQAKDEEAQQRYAASLDALDAAIRCRADPRTLRKAFELACSTGSRARAKLYWKRLAPAAQAEAKGGCLRNGITEAQLNTP